ncbi:MAG: Ppx/GppA family phosphatase [Coriobacteriia bacterium]|nr:Ppx/GppA family phosphatase [Coriobacteriia bacterium]
MASLTPGRYAAIDIGTVTCRLLVADVTDSGISQELAHGYKICNLGEGVDASGVLLPAAMERVDAAVADYLEQVRAFEQEVDAPVPVTCMATSASRDASNADEFTALLARRGIRPLVIPGQREAALSFSGASAGFEGERALVVDIGGGSTEVVAGMAGVDPDAAHSFNVGCRRVTERFFAQDPPSAEEVEQARAWIRQQMEGYFAQLEEQGLLPARMIAVAGTATTVVSMRKHMAEYDRDQVHHALVSRAMVDETYRETAGCPLDERCQLVGLDPGRAPVVVAGMVILQEVMALADADCYVVSESDILQGMVLAAAAGTVEP